MKSHKTNSLGLGPRTPLCGSHTPAITHKPQTTTHIGHSNEKNCFGTFSDNWFCHMEYFSMKVQ